jgi:hypothetical protein
MIEITALCCSLKRRKTRNVKKKLVWVSFVYWREDERRKDSKNEAIKHQSKRFEDQKLVAATKETVKKALDVYLTASLFIMQWANWPSSACLSPSFPRVLFLPFVMFHLVKFIKPNFLKRITIKLKWDYNSCQSWSGLCCHFFCVPQAPYGLFSLSFFQLILLFFCSWCKGKNCSDGPHDGKR